jgi:hypothetical protein
MILPISLAFTTCYLQWRDSAAFEMLGGPISCNTTATRSSFRDPESVVRLLAEQNGDAKDWNSGADGEAERETHLVEKV